MTGLSRRRFIRIAVGGAAVAAVAGPSALGAAAPLRRWKGTALGAAAQMVVPAADAERLVGLALSEVARLEAVFSLYRDDSALVRLNRDGVLEAPPAELVDLLARARTVSQMSEGAFDVTVQPLWSAYADAARRGGDPAEPEKDALAAALARVDWRAVAVAPERIVLGTPGMALTLNGIAQGYITDRVAELFRGEGYDNILIDLGETRALGSHPSGRPWRVALENGPDEIAVTDGAIATSVPSTGPIIDPRSGRIAGRHASVSVAASTATEADAWSTAFSLMPVEAIRHVLPRTNIRHAWLAGSRLT